MIERQSIVHETGFLGTPVPLYFETFSPPTPTKQPTVVMVHGGAHTGAGYQRTADGRPGWAYRFVARGHRVVVPDWPGIGRSAFLPIDQITGETVVRGLAALLQHIGEPVILLTHSMSGCYGWRLTELHGDLIAAVVGIAPSPPGNIQPRAPLFAETDTYVDTELLGHRTRIDKTKLFVNTRDFVERKLVGDGTRFPRDRIDAYVATLHGIAPLILIQRQNVSGRQVSVEDPSRLKGKRILVVTGTNDIDHSREFDAAIVDWLNQGGALAEFCFLADRGIAGNGHMLMLESNSDEIADIIIDWIGAL